MYSLVIKHKLDRESVSHYDVTITATDCGVPPLSTSRTLSIDVSDVNDNAPQFAQNPVELYLVENNEPGKPIFSVSASDKDLNENAALTYRIIREESSQQKNAVFLNINSDNGQITALKSFDFETLKTFQFQVVASDSGTPNGVWFILHVALLLFFGKEASAEIRYSVAEEVKDGTVVGNVAKDLGLDISSLTSRRFRVVSESKDAFFDVNQDNGDLYLFKKIDREELCLGSGACIMELKIIAENPLEIHYVVVEIIDINDHSPVFPEKEQRFEIFEQTMAGRRFQLHTARDPDSGINAIRTYTLTSNENFEVTIRQSDEDIIPFLVLKKSLDREKINKYTLTGIVDYEENDVYKLDIEASDKGTPPLTGECRLIIKIKDINDNPPEIEITSLSNTVSEDSKPGTMISLISVRDKDSGVNGKIILSLTSDLPFELKPSYKENVYSVVTKVLLDREEVSQYELTIKATDCGEPPLSTFKTLNIQIADVNDNRPHFPINPLHFYLSENNVAGKSIFSVSAVDKDLSDNAAISYRIVKEGSQNDIMSLLSINSDNGHISTLKSFDFETLKTFQFQVVASDSGTPSLSNNVTVNVFILDQNDNAPVILYPLSSNGSEVTDHSLFALDRYTGQIRTLRSFTETDEAEHKLLILVKDNGNVSLSATATVIVKLVEPKEAFAASDVKSTAKDDEDSNVIFYLMITLGAVSVLFLVSIIVLIAMQCSKPTDYTSKYLQEANYDGTLCHSIQYRSGDRKYMLVGPRMSIGSTIVPGSHTNTLVMPDRRRPSEEVG
uniref:Si:ch73-379j16.2 n=1 Tax=Maylandia zebra TaxID=106582 RepID=A0A3P9ATK1_9CICH